MDSLNRASAQTYRIYSGAIVALLLLAACDAPRNFDSYQAAITQFQGATDSTATVALRYVRDINAFEQEYEFKLLEGDASRELDLSKLMSPAFSPEAIRARSQAFDVLKQYTQMLAELAGSDATDRWKAATERAKTSADTLLKNLSDNIGILGGLPIANLTSPLKTIADAIAAEIINAKRAKALDAAIVKAAPAIQSISGGLREDLSFVVRQRDSVNQLNLVALKIEYQMVREAGNNSTRLKILKTVQQALDARMATLETLQGLSQALDRFDAAHDALVKYAKSDKGPQSLSGLIAVVRHYAAVAKEVFDSYKALSAAQ